MTQMIERPVNRAESLTRQILAGDHELTVDQITGALSLAEMPPADIDSTTLRDVAELVAEGITAAGGLSRLGKLEQVKQDTHTAQYADRRRLAGFLHGVRRRRQGHPDWCTFDVGADEFGPDVRYAHTPGDALIELAPLPRLAGAAHWSDSPGVQGVQLQAADGGGRVSLVAVHADGYMSPTEARKLAAAIVEHADRVDPDGADRDGGLNDEILPGVGWSQ